MAFRVSAPPFGHCSETTPSMVGQKNVLPKPYKVAKMKIIAKPCAVDRKNRPRTASAAERMSRPIGVSFSTIGPANQNLKTAMIAEV